MRLGIAFFDGAHEGDAPAVWRPSGLHHHGMLSGQPPVRLIFQVAHPEVETVRRAPFPCPDIGHLLAVGRYVEPEHIECAEGQALLNPCRHVEVIEVNLSLQKKAAAILLVGQPPDHLRRAVATRRRWQVREFGAPVWVHGDGGAHDETPAIGKPTHIYDATCEGADLLRRVAIDRCHMNLVSTAAGREEREPVAVRRPTRRRLASVAVRQWRPTAAVEFEVPEMRALRVAFAVNRGDGAHRPVECRHAMQAGNAAMEIEVLDGEWLGHD
jgi:hypothetical protein